MRRQFHFLSKFNNLSLVCIQQTQCGIPQFLKKNIVSRKQNLLRFKFLSSTVKNYGFHYFYVQNSFSEHDLYILITKQPIYDLLQFPKR